MAVNIRIDSFHELNVVERTDLSSDHVVDSTTLNVRSSQGLLNELRIYIGHLSREGVVNRPEFVGDS